VCIVMIQKKKLGLLRTPRYDIEVGPEVYYKTRVVELCEEYGEVSYALLMDKVPGAYDYLDDHHKEWLSEHLTSRWETTRQRTHLEDMQRRTQEAICRIVSNPPERQITFGYMAEVAGLTRDNLRSNSHIRACVDGIVESREDWYRRRITKAYYNMPVEGRPFSAIEICRAASVELKTFIKYQELFEEVVQELNANSSDQGRCIIN